jgi:hypothetical protein
MEEIDHYDHYIVKDYVLKDPYDFEGDQVILESDKVRPQNYLWEDRDERMSWMGDPDRKSNIHFPTYGTCGHCWASAPAYKVCIEC